jgi:putative membrane protein
MSAGPHLAYRHWLLVILLALFALSAIGPDHPRDFLLEHTFTAGLLAMLIWLDRRKPITSTTCTLLFIFLAMHVLGAHYTYSKVPYDAWSESAFGRSISAIFGFERNHYDRLVHFCFGLLLLLPMRELVERATPLRGGWSIIVAVSFLMMLSKLYELIEWSFSILLSPNDAEHYNGQQGDIFDAQKDMALAFMGATISALIAWISDRCREKSQPA